MSEEIIISKEIQEAAEWCFSILKKFGHFKGCNGAWEQRQIELAILNHSDLQTSQLREENKALKISREKWIDKAVYYRKSMLEKVDTIATLTSENERLGKERDETDQD